MIRYGLPLGVGIFGIFGWGATNTKQLGISDPWNEPTGTLAAPEREADIDDHSLEERRREKALAALHAEAEACRVRIDDALSAPALPGIPRLEAQRALLLARAKAEPVLFVDEPQFTGEVSRGMQARRQALLTSKYPRETFLSTIANFRAFPERLREVVLRDGYVYADDPNAAKVLIRDLKLDILFHEKEIMMQRGAQTFSLKKGDDGLFYVASGPEEGKRARLLLFDRVWLPGQEPGQPLHVDVREFAQRQGIDAMKIKHMSAAAIVADVRYGDVWAPALLERDETHLKMGCVHVEADRASEVGQARDAAYRRALVLRTLKSAIARQVEEGLPFDEPKTERGQQDGELRRRWEQAYFGGRKAYKFNGDLYQVFSSSGSPMTPQVCIDFITETLERASGMHFNPEGQEPQQVLGALDFDALLGPTRRQELAIRNYARENSKTLSLIDYPVSKWVPYEKIDKFFKFVEENRDDMRTGDIVIIRGRAAWDRYEEMHTHTFFVYESDPITGMPMLLAGNSGKPRIITWDSEMLRAPKRSIRHRIRPDTEWLYDNLVHKQPSAEERWAAPLTVVEDRE